MIKKILAIETSCDETAASVAAFEHGSDKIKILSSVFASQIKVHIKTKGVVPEVAARAHLQKISPIVKSALKQSKTELDGIDYIAVTYGPGLAPSLLVGVEFAKGLALATGKSLLPINHMAGHLYSAFINNSKVQLPSINLIVSGGHTYLVLLEEKIANGKKVFKRRILGRTVDDAAGEAFDKVAKMTGLPYPGGPSVSAAAKSGKKDYRFPRPMLNAKNYDFSFSGLKTAVLYKIAEEKLDVKNKQVRADISFSFENAAVDVLVKKTLRAAKEFKAKSATLSGGVAANSKLRSVLGAECKKAGIKLYLPDFSFCTDNAAMIANAAVIMLNNGSKPSKKPSSLFIDPSASL